MWVSEVGVEVGVDNPARGFVMNVFWGVASVIVIEGNIDASCSPVAFVSGSMSQERPSGVIRIGFDPDGGAKELSSGRSR